MRVVNIYRYRNFPVIFQSKNAQIHEFHEAFRNFCSLASRKSVHHPREEMTVAEVYIYIYIITFTTFSALRV